MITPTKDGNPLRIELIDAKTNEPKETLEVDVAFIATGRAPFTQGFGKFMSIRKHNVKYVADFYISDFQSRLMAVVKESYGAKVEQDILDFSKGLRVIGIKPTEKIALSADYS
ncbi:hypothetical protein Tco_0693378 [Tanacetum coccineum]